jgi:hypothetical protein
MDHSPQRVSMLVEKAEVKFLLYLKIQGKLKVRPERLELPTACSEDKCSVQLSYGRNFNQAVIIVQVAGKERGCYGGK